jgi:hypothetical protein
MGENPLNTNTRRILFMNNLSISECPCQTLKELRGEENNIDVFLTDGSIVEITGNPKDFISRHDLYDAYVMWCNLSKENATTARNFFSYLETICQERLGIISSDRLPKTRKRGYKAIKLKEGYTIVPYSNKKGE